ncbi:Hypothetical protein A7982_03655 [Minicystis rosea]|nr:Hypothetical protein A7982_03655 [Minicystis rosea]
MHRRRDRGQRREIQPGRHAGRLRRYGQWQILTSDRVDHSHQPITLGPRRTATSPHPKRHG